MSLLIKEGNTYNIQKRLYLCDTVAEFQAIPSDAPPYSEVIILTSPVARKMKKADGTWVDAPTGSGGAIDFTEPITVLSPTSDYNPATKKYVDDAIGGITEMDYQVVLELPTTGTKGVIYLIADSTGTNDNYDEYLWIGNAFEKIGNTNVDLSGYIPIVTGATGYVPKFDTNGTLISSGYTLEKSVPNNAIFTDTKYGIGYGFAQRRSAPNSHSVHYDVSINGFELGNGAIVYVRFPEKVVVDEGVYLNINETGAIRIYQKSLYEPLRSGINVSDVGIFLYYNFPDASPYEPQRKYIFVGIAADIDTSLNAYSPNLIQNKAVALALNDKADISHVHSNATTSVDGFLSSADKTKIDNLDSTYFKKSDMVVLTASQYENLQEKTADFYFIIEE